MKLILDPRNNLVMELAKIFSINQKIIQIYNNKDIKLFDKDFINIILKNS